MGRKVLIAGGAGFLGANLCRALCAKGAEVTVLDDLSSGRRHNLAPLIVGKGLQFVHGSVLDLPELEADDIYHLACPAAPRFYMRDPIETWRIATLGTHNLLNLATRIGARFLLASTSEVYGDPDVHPQPEEYVGSVDSVGPRACYAEGKRAAEALAADFARYRGVPVRIARIFNTYGPFMRPDDGRVIANFVGSILAGRDLTVHGNGSQTRSFCFVDDLIRGLIALMDSQPRYCGPVNLGNPQEICMTDLAHLMGEVAGVNVRLTFVPAPAGEPRRRKPDIGKARALLDFQPSVELHDGIDRTLRHFADIAVSGHAAGSGS